MSTYFRILWDGLDIFTHNKQTYFICRHLYLYIKDEMFNVRIKCHPGGSMTSRGVHKQHQRIPQTSHLWRYLHFVKIFIIRFHYVVLHSLGLKCSLNSTAHFNAHRSPKAATDTCWTGQHVLSSHSIQLYFLSCVAVLGQYTSELENWNVSVYWYKMGVYLYR